MTWRFQVLETAQHDFTKIETYLDSEAPGQSLRFIEDFETTVRGIAEHPLLRAEVRPNARRESLRIFKYHAWYRVYPEVEYVEVFAVPHHARGSKAIEERL